MSVNNTNGGYRGRQESHKPQAAHYRGYVSHAWWGAGSAFSPCVSDSSPFTANKDFISLIALAEIIIIMIKMVMSMFGHFD